MGKFLAFFLRQEKGQTSVEYILMFFVVVTLTLAMGKKLKAFLIGGGECPNTSVVCNFIEKMQGPGFLNGNYRYFTIKGGQ